MKNNFKIEISSDLKKDIQKYGNNIAKNIAIEAKEKLTSEYRYSVEEFYNSYTPEEYERTWQLRKSYRPYYRNAHGTRYHGGVEICVDKMKDTHSEPNEIVLGFALSGWHGHPNRGIYTPPYIYEHVEHYRDILFDYIDLIAAHAIEKSKKENYKVLDF